MTKKQILLTIFITLIISCSLLVGSIFLSRNLTAKAENNIEQEQPEEPLEELSLKGYWYFDDGGIQWFNIKDEEVESGIGFLEDNKLLITPAIVVCPISSISEDENFIKISLIDDWGTLIEDCLVFDKNENSLTMSEGIICIRANEVGEHYHAYGEWEIVSDALCTMSGLEQRLCECGEAETRTIAATAHSFTIISEEGNECIGITRHLQCEICGEEETFSILGIGHSFDQISIGGGNVERIPATCTSPAYDKEKCTREGCNEYLLTPVEGSSALGHDYEERVIAPTCTEAGYTLHTCKNCKHSYQNNEVPSTGHTFSEWVITQEPTSTENGIKQRTCTVCGAVETETIYYESGINFVGVNSLGNEATYEDEIVYYVVGDLTLNTMNPYQLQGNLSKYGGTGYTGTETEIVIPSTYKGKEVRMISRGAFYGIKTLERVVIEGETFIPSFTFIQSGLKEVVMHSTTPPQLTKNGFVTQPGPSGMGTTTLEKIYIPAGTLEAYKAASNWSDYADLFVEMEKIEFSK